MTKAFSYLRFSTPEQSQGDSERRQLEQSRRWASQQGLDLDDSLRDLGVSAYKGANIKQGALGRFLDAVDNGAVAKGSYLIVESLDRLSRDEVFNALDLFQTIIKRSVKIVTLFDQKVYDHETLRKRPEDLYYIIGSMHRAHEESETKAKRLRASWESKRQKIDQGIKLTGRCPAWLKLSADRTTFDVIEDRATTIRRIFEMTLGGIGKDRITRTLNTEGVPPFAHGKGWHASYVQKLLANEAVIGRFQAHRLERDEATGKKRRVPEGGPIDDYYPAIIDQPTFLRAQQVRTKRRIPSGPKGKKLSNLFTDIAVCGTCHAPMHYVNKGKPQETYLVCSSALRKHHDCPRRAWRYPETESLILDSILEINWKELHPAVYKEAVAKLRDAEGRIAKLEKGLSETSEQIDGLIKALAMSPSSEALHTRLGELEATKVELEAALEAAKEEAQAALERQEGAEKDHLEVTEALDRWREDGERLPEEEVFVARSRMAGLLRRSLERLEFIPEDPWEPIHSTVGTVMIHLAAGSVTRVLRIEADYIGGNSLKFERHEDGTADMVGGHLVGEELDGGL